MVTDKDSYLQLIEYLADNLVLFEQSHNTASNQTIIEVIEQELSTQIIAVCSQHELLTFNQRNLIIREVDAIVSDLSEILSGVMNQHATKEQTLFLVEFASLLKNIFDTEIQTLLNP